MEFLKAGLTFAVSTGTRMVAGLLVVKIIALYVGAGGLGQLGQFMSVVSMITVIAGGGISTGLVKYIAEYVGNNEELSGYLSSGRLITVISSSFIAIILCIFASQISQILIGTAQYADVIYVLAMVQFILGINNYAISIINGYRDAKGFAIVSVAGTIVGACFLYFAIIQSGLRGAMYGLVLMPTMVALFSIPYIFRYKLISSKDLWPVYNREKTFKLLQYSGMMLVTISTLPVAQIIIRNIIENRGGWEDVGYWQGVSKISDAYLQFVTVVLANYYLPKLSAKTNKIELSQEVYGALRISFPATFAMAFVVFLFKDKIITMLFTSAFMPMRDFFLFQMIGDCLKVCSWTIVYVGIAKAMTKVCILAEVFQSVCLVVLSAIFISRYGPVGATYAYALNYLIYFLLLVTLLRHYLKSDDAKKLLRC